MPKLIAEKSPEYHQVVKMLNQDSDFRKYIPLYDIEIYLLDRYDIITLHPEYLKELQGTIGA